MLLDRGLVCTRLRIVARTEGGEEMERTWRHDGALSVADVVDRIRWQCDGWITRSRLGGPATGAITRIGLHPLQLAPARSEEHTSELQSRGHLVCRLLLDKNTNRVPQACR